MTTGQLTFLGVWVVIVGVSFLWNHCASKNNDEFDQKVQEWADKSKEGYK